MPECAPTGRRGAAVEMPTRLQWRSEHAHEQPVEHLHGVERPGGRQQPPDGCAPGLDLGRGRQDAAVGEPGRRSLLRRRHPGGPVRALGARPRPCAPAHRARRRKRPDRARHHRPAALLSRPAGDAADLRLPPARPAERFQRRADRRAGRPGQRGRRRRNRPSRFSGRRGSRRRALPARRHDADRRRGRAGTARRGQRARRAAPGQACPAAP